MGKPEDVLMSKVNQSASVGHVTNTVKVSFMIIYYSAH